MGIKAIRRAHCWLCSSYVWQLLVCCSVCFTSAHTFPLEARPPRLTQGSVVFPVYCLAANSLDTMQSEAPGRCSCSLYRLIKFRRKWIRTMFPRFNLEWCWRSFRFCWYLIGRSLLFKSLRQGYFSMISVGWSSRNYVSCRSRRAILPMHTRNLFQV